MEPGQKIQWQKEKEQTMIYKTLLRKLKIEQNESHKKPGVNSESVSDFCSTNGNWIIVFF